MGNNTLNSYLSTGINLSNGGAYLSPFTVMSTGTIKTGGNYGVYSSLTDASLTNDGFISAAFNGVRLLGGGVVENLGSSSVIAAATEAVVINGASGYLLNQGTIAGASFNDVILDDPTGTIVNDGLVTGTGTGLVDQYNGVILNNGLISAGEGIKLFGPSGTVVNAGTVDAQSFAIIAYGTVVNSGAISAQSFGIVLGNTSTVVNSGLVFAGTGITLEDGGSLLNTGTISAWGIGVNLESGGTLINGGTISGGGGAVNITGTAATTVIVEPGAVFNGGVQGSSHGANMLELAGTGGALTGIGSQFGSAFIGFQTIAFAPGASWRIAGDLAGLAAGQTITGFAQGDTIILDSFAATSELYTGGAELLRAGGLVIETLDIGPLPANDIFAVSSDGHSTTITAENTLISIISTTLTNAIIPGTGSYAANLTITNTGAIVVSPDDIAIEGNSATQALSITNYGQISGSVWLAIAGPDSSVNNHGTIAGALGVTMDQGNVTNSGSIISSSMSLTGFVDPGNGYGVNLEKSTLTNTGSIFGPVRAVAANGGFIDNAGAISGGTGVDLNVAKLDNSGTVSGTIGVYAVDQIGNTLSNTGTILGVKYGVDFGGPATLANAGEIYGSRVGLYATGKFFNNPLYDGHSLSNTGSIGGGSIGVEFSYSIGSNYIGVSTVTYGVKFFTNAGTISGGTDAIENRAGTLFLTVDPGAVFEGNVVDQTGHAGLTLAGTTAGSLAMGNSFSGFSKINFAAGSTWALSLDAPSFGSTDTFTGLTASDTLDVSHLAGAGTIELAGFSASSYTFVSGTGLILANATTNETIVTSGGYTTRSFTVTDDFHGNIEVSVACFVRGTRILTPRGNVPIEKLNIGDLVKTMHGDQPIRWIGRRAYAGRFIAGNPDAMPIRIRRHAIALNIPSRDLYVSPDHAIAEGGVLIHARLLLNGISFQQPKTESDVEYFHLEFDSHTILFAENFSVESFIDEGAGNRFQNAHTRIPSLKPQKPCLPRVFEGFHLHNIKSRIALRAGIPTPTQFGALLGTIDECSPTLIRGWAQNSAAPEHPVTLEIISGGFSRLILANAYRPDLRDAGIGSGCHGFSLTLPNLQHPVSIRAADHAPLRHARPGQRFTSSQHHPCARTFFVISR